jgi:hypothetical protein
VFGGAVLSAAPRLCRPSWRRHGWWRVLVDPLPYDCLSCLN